ncbi:hypothetical protein NHF46_19865 [Arthrobacter alpinus]|nr:hypothetical protein [Arthrobacter alpinus]
MLASGWPRSASPPGDADRAGEYIFLAGRSAQNLPLSAGLVLTGAGSCDRAPGDAIRAEHFDAAQGVELVPETHLAGTAIKVASGHRSALAYYKNWSALPAGPGELRVLDGGSGRVSFERAGAAGTWLPWLTVDVPLGSGGVIDFDLPTVGNGLPADLRVGISGDVTLVALRLGKH